jgi:uncharacterized RDD family membrane protein YckC
VSTVAASEVHELLGRRAGLISRFAADAIDLVLVLVAIGVVYLGVAATRFVLAPRRFAWPSPGALLISIFGWGLLIVYLTVAWNGTGRSVGKQVMGLRVERQDAGGLRLRQAFLRAVLCAALPIGLFWSLFSRDSASIQDLLVRTKVVYDWRPRVPARAEPTAHAAAESDHAGAS